VLLPNIVKLGQAVHDYFTSPRELDQYVMALGAIKLPEIAEDSPALVGLKRYGFAMQAAGDQTKTAKEETKELNDLFKLQSAAWKQLDADSKAAAKSEAEWAKVMAELDSAGKSSWATVAGMNGDVVEAIKYYLEAGVSQSTLAKAYDVTATQVRAVADTMKEYTASLKEAQKIEAGGFKPADLFNELGKQSQDTFGSIVKGFETVEKAEADYHDYTMKATMDAESYKLTKIWETVDQKEKAFAKSVNNDLVLTTQFNAAVEALATDETNSILATMKGGTDAAVGYVKSAFDLMVGESVKALDVVTTNASKMAAITSGSMSSKYSLTGPNDPKLSTFGPTAQAAKDDYGNWYAYVPGVNAAPNKSTEGSFGSSLALSRSPGTISGTRAAGGPTTPGQSYWVGETGPELFTPQQAGYVHSGNSVNVNAGAVQMNYPIMNDPGAMNHLADVVGEALLSKLRRSGVTV